MSLANYLGEITLFGSYLWIVYWIKCFISIHEWIFIKHYWLFHYHWRLLVCFEDIFLICHDSILWCNLSVPVFSLSGVCTPQPVSDDKTAPGHVSDTITTGTDRILACIIVTWLTTQYYGRHIADDIYKSKSIAFCIRFPRWFFPGVQLTR